MYRESRRPYRQIITAAASHTVSAESRRVPSTVTTHCNQVVPLRRRGAMIEGTVPDRNRVRPGATRIGPAES